MLSKGFTNIKIRSNLVCVMSTPLRAIVIYQVFVSSEATRSMWKLSPIAIGLVTLTPDNGFARNHKAVN